MQARQNAAMHVGAILLLALAMSTDAFAAAVCKGAALHKPDWREAVRTGAIFGGIEAITPLVGWLLGSVAARYVTAWGNWIAFTLLAALGLRMIWAGWHATADAVVDKPGRHSLAVLAATGLATSIDAMAVGASLAFVDVSIMQIALSIGAATFAMVTIGVLLGRVLGTMAGKWAEIAGGLVLIGIGAMILLQQAGVT
jgi:manganese efflux pump family protein